MNPKGPPRSKAETRGGQRLGALALLPLALALAVGCDSDRVDPVPTRLPYLEIKLPSGVRDYRAYEAGLQHSMVQLRFEVPATALSKLEAALPCRLGPIETGPPAYAEVASNDRGWYTPEAARKHRGCQYSKDSTTASFLVDLESTDHGVVYAVISKE